MCLQKSDLRRRAGQGIIEAEENREDTTMRYILESQLKAYSQSGLYPMHMPGHKRQLAPAPELPYDWDMTEVPGVDDLHEAEGILAEAMARTAALHGAARTWYLVGGSTCGLLAGIRALAPFGSRLIVARNCHKAVYHAIELGRLRPRWLTPPVDAASGVYGSISPEQVREALDACPDAACVVLTSPTYEGVLSDIASIAALCHEKGVSLLVDEAHGAHLGLASGWPKSAVQLGADVVVQSAHKTLPSLTQTALLHLGKNSLADLEEIERQLDVFETSSPSYPLLVSLDGCTGTLREDGARLFADWAAMLERFDRTASFLDHFTVLCRGRDSLSRHPDFFDFDPSKLPICTGRTGETGTSLAAKLRQQGFETEMACGNLTLAMTGLSDDPAAVERFGELLVELDRQAEPRSAVVPAMLPPPGEAVCTMGEALLLPTEETALTAAEGRVSGEYLWAYPPGVPLVAPGERITGMFLDAIRALEATGTVLHHSHCKNAENILVLS